MVHAAWDFRPTRPEEIRRVNGEGSIRLFDAFEAAGGGTGVFISTIAAFDGCKSHYGKISGWLRTPRCDSATGSCDPA